MSKVARAFLLDSWLSFFCISNLINKVKNYAIENNDKKSARRTSTLFFLAWQSTSSAYSLYRNLSKFKRGQVPPNWLKHKNNSLKHWKKVKMKQRVQKEPRKNKLEEDWNGWQLWFLKRCWPWCILW